MKLARRTLLALAALAVSSPIAAATPPRDWSKFAQREADGTFLLGNPAAKVKLVEYLSLTCPHCALFESEAVAPLTAKYVRPGLVSYEVRHALRDGFDYAGAVLSRCKGPGPFFATLPKVFAQQDDWFARAQTWSQTVADDQTQGQTPEQLLPKLARGAGFDTVFGMTPAQMDSCLANAAERKLVGDQADEAWHRPGFNGTPGFLINGTLRSDVRDWPTLDAALTRALGARPGGRSSNAVPHHPLPRKTGRK